MPKRNDDPNTPRPVVVDLSVRGQSVACPHEHMDDDGGPPRPEPEDQ